VSCSQPGRSLEAASAAAAHAKRPLRDGRVFAREPMVPPGSRSGMKQPAWHWSWAPRRTRCRQAARQSLPGAWPR
jgi:hypothetical protein